MLNGTLSAFLNLGMELSSVSGLGFIAGDMTYIGSG